MGTAGPACGKPVNEEKKKGKLIERFGVVFAIMLEKDGY